LLCQFLPFPFPPLFARQFGEKFINPQCQHSRLPTNIQTLAAKFFYFWPIPMTSNFWCGKTYAVVHVQCAIYKKQKGNNCFTHNPHTFSCSTNVLQVSIFAYLFCDSFGKKSSPLLLWLFLFLLFASFRVIFVHIPFVLFDYFHANFCTPKMAPKIHFPI
jgi:hypothetical protein